MATNTLLPQRPSLMDSFPLQNSLLRDLDSSDMLSRAMGAILERYPALKPYGIQAQWGSPEKAGGRRLEFYPPQEERNPRPGIPLVEVFDRSLVGDDLQRAIFGDALHYLPSVDQKYRSLRNKLGQSLTSEQKDLSKQRYEWYKQNWGEGRPYNQWFEISDLDQFLGGYLAPPANNEWEGSYTKEQEAIMDEMRRHLQGQD